jgi:hypothetical protein
MVDKDMGYSIFLCQAVKTWEEQRFNGFLVVLAKGYQTIIAIIQDYIGPMTLDLLL